MSEEHRQLKAAAEGRYRQNNAGRYVIDGEARPDRKTRESSGTVGLKLTSEGEAALRVLEAADHV